MLGSMHGELNEQFLVSILVGPDDKNSSVNILVVSVSFNYGNIKRITQFLLIFKLFFVKKLISILSNSSIFYPIQCSVQIILRNF